MTEENQTTESPAPAIEPDENAVIEATAEPTAPPEPAQWQPKRRRFGGIAILIASIAGAFFALYAWRLPPFGLGEVYSNNAYVRGSVTVISPRVGGYVQKVLVQDFAAVKAGQPLVEIDAVPYQTKVAQAKAGVLGQQAALHKSAQDKKTAIADAKAGEAAVANVQAQYERANREWKRIKATSSDAVSQSNRDAAQTAVKQAEAGLKQAKAQYAVAQQNIATADVGREGAEAALANAQALLDLAEQELGHTIVYAPTDGRLGEVAVKNGQLVSAGMQV